MPCARLCAPPPQLCHAHQCSSQRHHSRKERSLPTSTQHQHFLYNPALPDPRPGTRQKHAHRMRAGPTTLQLQAVSDTLRRHGCCAASMPWSCMHLAHHHTSACTHSMSCMPAMRYRLLLRLSCYTSWRQLQALPETLGYAQHTALSSQTVWSCWTRCWRRCCGAPQVNKYGCPLCFALLEALPSGCPCMSLHTHAHQARGQLILLVSVTAP